MSAVDGINQIIKENAIDTNLISDGYHTFGELYDHRIQLFIALCRYWQYAELDNGREGYVWKSKMNSDGSIWNGWFLLGMNDEPGKQITYHLPISKWDECDFQVLAIAPPFDGHTSADVLERLKLI